MIGGLKQTTSRLAIAAAAGLFTGGIALTPVHAADLGGDCCADLEERVAELEATTVRKGNRKVSLKLSGQVTRNIMWWDDGEDDDVYLMDNGPSNSRFSLSGSATISPGRTVGFKWENDLGISNDPNDLSNCDTDTLNNPQCMTLANANESTIGVRFADIWFNDEQLGKFSIGQGNTASNGTAEVDLSGTGIAGVYSLMTDQVSGFFFRNSATGGFTGISIAGNNLDGGSRQDRIRYDTPSLAGFTLSTSYAADDFVDFAVRFKKEWNSVRCAAALGYAHDTNTKDYDSWQLSTSGSCIHTPSGLNLTLAYGDLDVADTENNSGAVVTDPDTEFWFIKGGIYRRWNSHGKTAIAVGYAEYDDVTATGDDLDAWGIELVQNIDAAALQLWASYQHFEYSDTTTTSYQDFDAVITGARIKF